ncbi:hypothetical protein ECDEC10F_4647 [Escherichia coli DEC10F]|nr:hypothetical protein ECDEC10F_4647 [Escherichia coli DEC10F]
MSGIFPLISVGKIIPVSTTGISSPSGNSDDIKKQILIPCLILKDKTSCIFPAYYQNKLTI